MKTSVLCRDIISSIFVVTFVVFSSSAQAKNYHGKKILYINSYHAGYQHSDEEQRGAEKKLAGTGVLLKTIYMDSKRNPSEEYAQQKALEIKNIIAEFKPDIIISADDSAFKYVIQPYYRDSALAVVFCGINWDVSVYGAPYKNTTGVLEVALMNQLSKNLKPFAKGTRLAVLAFDHFSERKHVSYLSKQVEGDIVETAFVKDFASWKEKFLELQDKADMIIFTSTEGIINWDIKEAADFVNKNIRIPTGTGITALIPISLITLAHLPEEQGELAADIALKILDGAKPSDIPIMVNKRGDFYLNLILADKLTILFPPRLIRNAKGVYGFVEQ